MKIEFLHKLTTNSQSKVKGLAKFWLLLIFLLGSTVPALANANAEALYMRLNNRDYTLRSGGTGSCTVNPTSFSGDMGTIDKLTLQGLTCVGTFDGSDWIAGKVWYKVYKDGTQEPSGNTGDFGVGNYDNVGAGRANVVSCGNTKQATQYVDASINLSGSLTPGVKYRIKVYWTTKCCWNNNGSSGTWGETSGNNTMTFTIKKPCTPPSNLSITANPAKPCQGGATTLTFSGTNVTDQQWYKGGSQISGATGKTYSVTNAQAATYKVVAWNGETSCKAEKSFSLTVTPLATKTGYKITTSSVPYNGSEQPVGITVTSGYPAVTTIYYAGSTTVPSLPGTYAITIDTDANGNYCAGTGLSLGNYTITKLTATKADYGLTNTSFNYDGTNKKPTITVKTTGAPAAETVTYYKKGSSTAIKTDGVKEAGTYEVKVSGAATSTYEATNNLYIGDFTISGYELYLGTTKLGNTTDGGATLTKKLELPKEAYKFLIIDKATGVEVKYGNKTINRTSDWTELAQSATQAILNVDEAGSYNFDVKVTGGKVQVKVTYPEKTPDTPGSVSGADKLCPGTSSEGYKATGDAYTKSFRWAIEGTGWDVSPKTTGLDGTVKVTAGTAESATLKVWAVNENKESAAPLTKTISLKHAPATPTITGEGSASPGQKGLKYSVENVPGETYTWSVSAGWDITSSNIGNEITVTAGTTQGTITVEASNTNGCGTATASKQVSVSAIEAPEFTQVVSESCPNTTHTFTISPISTAGASYVWTVPTGNGWAVNPNDLSAQVTVGTTAGTVSVHAVVNGVAGKNAEQSVSIKPSVGAVTITGTTTVKKGSVVTYTASADNATSYSWELPSEWTAPAKTGASIKVTFGQNSTQNTIKCIAKDACDRTSEKSITITYQKANAVKDNYWVDPATAPYTGSTVNTTVKKYSEVPDITEIKYYKGGQLDPEHKTAGKYQLKVSGAETLEYNAVTDLDLGEAFTIEGYEFALSGSFDQASASSWEDTPYQIITSDGTLTFKKNFNQAGKYYFLFKDKATGEVHYYKGGAFTRGTTGWQNLSTTSNDATLQVDEFGKGEANAYTFTLKKSGTAFQVKVDYPAKTPDAPKWDAHPEKMCPNADAVFSVTPVEGATYNWTASNGWTITPNTANPYQATLHSGATGTSKVSVTVTKSGKTSKAIEQSVALISSLAQPGAISGKTKVVAEENGVTYSVAAVPDAEEYIWTLPQGWLIASGKGTRSISVSVGASSGVKTIKVQAKNACFTSAARELQVTVDTKPVTGMMYFDNTYTKFAQPWLYIGHGLNGGYTKNYKMERVKGTQYLWYSTQGWWNDAQGWYIAYTNVWSDGQGTNEPYYKLACHFSNKEATIDWLGDFSNNYVYKAQSGTSNYDSDCSDGKHSIQVYKWYDDASKKISYSTYTVTVNKTGKGTVTLKDYDQRGVASGAKVSYLTSLKMTATAEPGYTLIGVKDGAGYPWENPSTNAYTIKNNTTFNVKFVKNPDAPQVDGKQTTKGAPVLLTVKNHVAGQQYEWYNKDTGVKISGSSDQITVSPEKTTNYKVRAKISEDGKTIYSEFGFVTVEVLQELPLTVSVVGGSNPTCPNQTVTLSATTGNVNETFVEWWSTEDDGKTPYRMLQTTAKNNPDYSTNFTTTIYETTTYYVVAYADPVGKTVIGKTLFTVTAKTAKIVIDPQTTAKSPYKAGNTIYLKLDPEEYVTSATWRLPNGQTFTGKRCSFTIPQGVLGVYNVSATIQDDCTSSRQLSIALPVSGGAIQATTTSFTIKENDASKVLNIGFTPEPTEIVCTKVVSQPAGSEYASVEDIVIKGTQLSWNVPKSPANGAYKYQIRASRDQYDDYIGTITINYTDDGASCKIVLVDGAIDGNKIFPYEPVNMKIANNNPQGVVWSVEAPASEKPAISNVTISGGTSKLQFRVPKLGKVSNSLYIVYATCTSQDGKKSSVQEYKFYLQETEDEHCN